MSFPLSSIEQTIHIKISEEQFKQLRNPNVTKEMIEIDGSCDYSNQL